MIDVKTNSSNKLKSQIGSTETLDGLNDLELSDNTEAPKIRRGPNNLTIILIAIFITWLILFMGVTIYQIRGYKKALTEKKIRNNIERQFGLMRQREEDRRADAALKNQTINSDNPENTKTESHVNPLDSEVPKNDHEEKVTIEPEVLKDEHKVEWTKPIEQTFENPIKQTKVVEPVLKEKEAVTHEVTKPVVSSVDSKYEGKVEDEVVRKEEENIVPGSRRESITPEGVKYVKVKLHPDPNQSTKRREKRVFMKLDEFMTPKKLAETSNRFEDTTFIKQGVNCYRRDFYRYNIDGKGTNMRLIAKKTHIRSKASLNSGKCVTIYHWIYNNPQTKTTNIFYLGPYYGNYSVNILEDLLLNADGKGSFKISGCDESSDGSATNLVTKSKEKIIRGTVKLNKDLYMYNNFDKYQTHLETRAKEEIYENKRLFEVLREGPNAITDFNHLNQTADCIFAL